MVLFLTGQSPRGKQVPKHRSLLIAVDGWLFARGRTTGNDRDEGVFVDKDRMRCEENYNAIQYHQAHEHIQCDLSMKLLRS